MRDLNLSLLTAAFTTLDGNLSLNSANVPVYDRVPIGASKPYVRVYQITGTDGGSSKDAWIHDVVLELHVVTEYTGSAGGKEDANVISGQIYSIMLPDSPSGYMDLSPDFNIYITRLESDRFSVESIGNDTVIYTRIIRIGYVIEETVATAWANVSAQHEYITARDFRCNASVSDIAQAAFEYIVVSDNQCNVSVSVAMMTEFESISVIDNQCNAVGNENATEIPFAVPVNIGE